MTCKSGQLNSLAEVKEYNKKDFYLGIHCISSMACEHCFAIITDTVCCCAGIICTECGKKTPDNTALYYITGDAE